MSEIYYSCGCNIILSMFGEREIIRVMPCIKHAFDLQNELKALSDKLIDKITIDEKRIKG